MEQKDRFLDPEGKNNLKKILEEVDNPLSFIETLHSCNNFNFSRYSSLYVFGEAAGFDPSVIFEKYVTRQQNMIKEKIPKMTKTQLNDLLKQLDPYSKIPIFQDLIRCVLAKLNDVPKWFEVPEVIKSELQPIDKLNIFKNHINDFRKWVEEVMNEAICDFKETDDFSYIECFEKLSKYCFYKRDMYNCVANYCEKKFMENYHPIYCVIRIRLAIHNSPLSKVDCARPLSFLVTRATLDNAKVDFAQIENAAKACGGISQIILSLPNFTLKYRLRNYIKAFGVTTRDKMIWSNYLNTGDSEAVNYMLKNKFFARVIGVSVIQETPLRGNLFITLKDCEPQCDVAYIMCRKYKNEYEKVLKEWASKNGSVFIDYLTLCHVKGKKFQDIQVPFLTDKQKEIYESSKI